MKEKKKEKTQNHEVKQESISESNKPLVKAEKADMGKSDQMVVDKSDQSDQSDVGKADQSDQSDQSDVGKADQAVVDKSVVDQSDQSVVDQSDQSDQSDVTEPADDVALSDDEEKTKDTQEQSNILLPEGIDITDDERKSVIQITSTLAREQKKGVLSKKSVDLLLRALHHDRDVATASKEGEIKGRNTRIDEYLLERKNATSIHQPGSAAQTQRHTLPYSRIGGLSAADRQTIWERGNEKRVRY